MSEFDSFYEDGPLPMGFVQEMNMTACGFAAGQTGEPVETEAAVDRLAEPAEAVLRELAEPRQAPLLANRKPPFYHVQQEKPHHRVFIELAAKGYTVKEIAEKTGFTPVCVNNILRQPPLQQTLVNEIERVMGADEQVVKVIRETVVDAVTLLRNTIIDPKQRTVDRLSAAEKILERRYGKANQPINRGTDVDLNALSNAELAKIAMGDN